MFRYGGRQSNSGLAFDECQREPVAVTTNASSCKESCECNRVQESFALCLSQQPWATETESCSALYQTIEVWHNGQISIERRTPRWVNPNDVFEVRLVVTALVNGAPSAIVVTEELPAALGLVQSPSGNNKISMAVGNTAHSVTRASYLLRAGDETGSAPIGIGVTGSELADPITGFPVDSPIGVTDESITDLAAQQYLADTLRPCAAAPAASCVGIARLALDGAGQLTAVDPLSETQIVPALLPRAGRSRPAWAMACNFT